MNTMCKKCQPKFCEMSPLDVMQCENRGIADVELVLSKLSRRLYELHAELDILEVEE